MFLRTDKDTCTRHKPAWTINRYNVSSPLFLHINCNSLSGLGKELFVPNTYVIPERTQCKHLYKTSHSRVGCTDVAVCLVIYVYIYIHYEYVSVAVFRTVTHTSHTVTHRLITWLTYKLQNGYWDTAKVFKWQLKRLKTIKGVQIRLAPVVLS